ncbi:homeobox and c2h2 transcription [Dichotomopilus funicola]|uniref:Homeobox and c2h2 transcription n=1 Tax=Dichotomopilus funicola TaxID=1934379 RepID=A0AAN6V158_9PEZI|nr:homeobox and c2h2 transcription [Dichotomopilus funicola]
MASTASPSFSTGHEPNARHTRQKFSRHAKWSTRILNQWFFSHPDHPYPTEEEKSDLATRTGLTVRQISFWFINARRRKATHLQPPAPTTTANSCFGSTSWEAGSILSGSGTGAPRSGSSGSVSQLSSLSSSGSAATSGDTSHFPGGWTLRRQHGRRRRARGRKAPSQKNNNNPTTTRPYQCTFCPETFKTRYDWTRHESTLHLPLEKWTCLATGPIYHPNSDHRKPNSTAKSLCALCHTPSPTATHLATHNTAECLSKPPSARTFFRKDHLRQHLRACHGGSAATTAADMARILKEWKSVMKRVKSRCGFCGEEFLDWARRCEHVAEHFRREGRQMGEWKGGLGLEGEVLALVENAEFVIDDEKNGIGGEIGVHEGIHEDKGIDPGGSSLPGCQVDGTNIHTAQAGDASLEPFSTTLQYLDSYDPALTEQPFFGEDTYTYSSIPWPWQTPEYMAGLRTGVDQTTPMDAMENLDFDLVFTH